MSLPPHDANKHPPGFTAIATIGPVTIARCNGAGYLLDDEAGTQTALSRLPKARLVELVLDEARTVARLRDGLAAVFRNGTDDQT